MNPEKPPQNLPETPKNTPEPLQNFPKLPDPIPDMVYDIPKLPSEYTDLQIKKKKKSDLPDAPITYNPYPDPPYLNSQSSKDNKYQEKKKRRYLFVI